MKKTLTIVSTLLAALLAAGTLAGCGEQQPDTPDVSGTTDVTTDAPVTTEPPAPASAFEGEAEEILDAIYKRAAELNTDKEYGIGAIEGSYVTLTAERSESVLGMSAEAMAEVVEVAVEWQPNGSWFPDGVVLVKLKDGADVGATAETIIMGCKPNRFGCLKPKAIAGGYAGRFVIYTAAGESDADAIYAAFAELSALPATRIDRENTWSSQGGLLIGG